jgi:FkbM family methyltransferase
MEHRIIIFLRFIQRFGILKGLFFSIKFALGRVEKVKLKKIKHPFFLRKKTSDIPTFYQVFLFQEYNIRFPHPPQIIIDGGANIGLFAIKMKNDFPDSKIICVEPDSENLEVLQKNISPYSNITIEPAGLWNKDTLLHIYDKYNSGKWGMVVEEDLIQGTVHAISISSLMQKHQLEYIDVLKIDIETSEKQLFSENYENWLPRVKTIIIELHDWMEKGCSKPFFTAINKSFTNYSFSSNGENVVITNLDLE